MSYILDALRRADAERQRGAVPDLHAQPAGAAASAQASAAAERSTLQGRGALLAMVAGAVALAVALAVAVAWWLGRGSLDEPVPGVAPVSVPAAPASPARVSDLPTVAPAALPPAPAAPLAAGPAPAALPARVVASPVAPAPASAPTRAAAAASTTDASASDPVIRWAALPESTRSSLPALAWSGGVYADQPSQRLVVVNGQVAREGDELAPGLRLEQIRPKAVVVRWRGQRIELPI